MGWDAKQRGPERGYYYRWHRVDGVLKKQYVGRGSAAQMASLLDEREREERLGARMEVFKERADLALADLALKHARELTDLLAEATFILAGYHLHHGCLRRRRAAHAKNGA